ncbi:hypothetical protein NSR00_03890 [Aeribacillus sp. FSL K6-8394]|uniref:hypothetical protein n=1 Tax=Aeribacillus sp. FSL K6-8394 TaxID=2954570 RepID=UPI0030F669C8
MIYRSVKQLEKEYKLKEALRSVRDLWYKLTEGYVTIPESAEKLQSFIEYFEGELPAGWILTMDEQGTIHARTNYSHRFSQMLICKSFSGKERVKIIS